MLTLPTIIERAARPYVAIRKTLAMADIKSAVDRSFGELFGWMGDKEIEPKAAPFLKYNIIDMAGKLEIEFGAPTSALVSGEGRFIAGTLPAGRYGMVLYHGPYSNLLDVNAVLIGWAKEKGIRWDVEETAAGDRFACRIETYITDPRTEPDQNKWQTEVAIRIADK